MAGSTVSGGSNSCLLCVFAEMNCVPFPNGKYWIRLCRSTYHESVCAAITHSWFRWLNIKCELINTIIVSSDCVKDAWNISLHNINQYVVDNWACNCLWYGISWNILVVFNSKKDDITGRLPLSVAFILFLMTCHDILSMYSLTFEWIFKV